MDWLIYDQTNSISMVWKLHRISKKSVAHYFNLILKPGYEMGR